MVCVWCMFTAREFSVAVIKLFDTDDSTHARTQASEQAQLFVNTNLIEATLWVTFLYVFSYRITFA